ncbi:Phthiocerol synthesis polyketide synthase type I PpsC [Corynebacterium glaucum]|uniref:beta-ketoacyl synthase N-terminal-like domain-containing protein n=1 Tax=Corynebacterium glaucum TaxID=187491 RepID=UPI0025B2B59A|nr:beta-ketoacyl synthase N-terminal-like domain-containing protein [Corynebacterium glaucum]WJZ06809.1 Phthiocerol synthesis polyketide synthase type I PpsC [Corynebacterium glaucum]
MKEMTAEPIAIIGRGCAFPPNSDSLDGYWNNMLDGKMGITVAPDHRWRPDLHGSDDRAEEDKTYCVKGGFLDDHCVDPDPVLRSLLTAQQNQIVSSANRTAKMAINATLQALREAGMAPLSEEMAGASVFVGNMLGDEALSDRSLKDEAQTLLNASELSSLNSNLQDEFLKNLNGFTKGASFGPKATLASGIAPTIAEVVGTCGPAMLVDGACASGLLVVDLAARALRQRRTSLAIVIGSMGNMGVAGNVSFAKIGGLSPTSSRPLNAAADGLIPGEGAGTVILKRLSDAERDGDKILGVIRGVATATDGKGRSIYAPDTRGQQDAMRAALAQANLNAADIDKVELHATGTPTGDRTELESVQSVFSDRAEGSPLVLGTGKSLIGHTFAAAGMANLIKVSLEIERRWHTPAHNAFPYVETIGQTKNQFRLSKSGMAWGKADGQPRRALTNAFGFGGVNTSLVLEEYLNPSSITGGIRSGAPSSAQPLAVIGFAAATPSQEPTADAVELPISLDAGKSLRFQFPFREFRLPPVTVEHMDKSQQLTLTLAARALEDAELLNDGRVKDPERFAAILGAAAGLEAALERNLRVRLAELQECVDQVDAPAADKRALSQIIDQYVRERVGPTTEASLPGYMDNISPGRVSNVLDTRGFNCSVDQDKASFGASLVIAESLLMDHACDFVLVGAVNTSSSSTYERLWAEQSSEISELVEAGAMFVVTRMDNVPEEITPYGFIQATPTNDNVTGEGIFDRPGASAMAADDALWTLDRLMRAGEGPFRRTTVSYMSGSGYTIAVASKSELLRAAGSKANTRYQRDTADRVRVEGNTLKELIENVRDLSTGTTDHRAEPQLRLIWNEGSEEDALRTRKAVLAILEETVTTAQR